MSPSAAHPLILLLGAALSALAMVGAALLRRLRCADAIGAADLALVAVALLWGSALGAAATAWASGGDWTAPPSDAAALVGTATGALVAAGLCLARVPAQALGLRRFAPRWLAVALLGLPLFLGLSALWSALLDALGVAWVEQGVVGVLRDAQGSPLGAFSLLYAVALAPLCEETLFRGLLLRAWQARLGPAPRVLLSALAFGALHATDPQAVPPLVALGLMLGWLRIASGSLWPGVLLHALNNGVVVIGLLSNPS